MTTLMLLIREEEYKKYEIEGNIPRAGLVFSFSTDG